MSVEPVPQELTSESQSPDQQALDAIARLHAEKQELEREGYAMVRPGANEADALGNVAITAFGWGWLGTALAGACFGTLAFPLLGTIAGFFIAGIVSLLPCMFAAMLYVMSRGRISAIFAMAWAGAGTGVVCFSDELGRDAWLGMVFAGVIGATGARLSTKRALQSYLLQEGFGARSIRQFSIFDLMILTGWLAVFFTALQIVTQIGELEWSATLTCVAVSLACAAVIEGIAQLSGAMRTDLK